jgi:hypothetical protein
MDLVDEMMWEDIVEFETLEDAGLEESADDDPSAYGHFLSSAGSIFAYTDWFYDGDKSAFSAL